MTQTEPKLIKVGYNDEWLWAIDLGDGKAEINNVPFSDGLGFKDIVSYDEMTHKIIKVLKSTVKTFIASYDRSGTREELKARFMALCTYLQDKGFITEGCVAGLVSVSVPKKLTKKQFIEILKTAPYRMELGVADITPVSNPTNN